MTHGLETGASPLKYPSMVMFRFPTVIICIRRGGNQRGVLSFFIRKNISQFFKDHDDFFYLLIFFLA